MGFQALSFQGERESTAYPHFQSWAGLWEAGFPRENTHPGHPPGPATGCRLPRTCLQGAKRDSGHLEPPSEGQDPGKRQTPRAMKSTLQ